MKANKFNKLMKENKDNLQRIIYMHTQYKIFLTKKQLDEVIRKRGDKTCLITKWKDLKSNKRN